MAAYAEVLLAAVVARLNDKLASQIAANVSDYTDVVGYEEQAVVLDHRVEFFRQYPMVQCFVLGTDYDLESSQTDRTAVYLIQVDVFTLSDSEENAEKSARGLMRAVNDVLDDWKLAGQAITAAVTDVRYADTLEVGGQTRRGGARMTVTYRMTEARTTVA